jgi:diadenosine tetraphosphate (Ap4A) HIT family hydrolase
MDNQNDLINLEDFIRCKMKMSHIYQPVMLSVLLREGGEATLEQIAKALLSYDLPQIEYYSLRTKNMVGKVLIGNDVVEPIKVGRKIAGYKLKFRNLTEDQRVSLAALCDEKLHEYVEGRGAGIWGHRRLSEGYVSGSIRYEVLKRAKHRCELCGAHEKQSALHIDHIIPRAKGGSDDLSNFQVLCMSCNTSKRDRDDTDFRGILASYQHRDSGCLFCELTPDRIIDENELCLMIEDAFPVTPQHTLIIPKRHVADYFDLYQPELNAIHSMLSTRQQFLLKSDPTISGFNIGINAGRSAGQTIFHVHVHLIPRRDRDVEDPRGGVRGVIPSKQRY